MGTDPFVSLCNTIWHPFRRETMRSCPFPVIFIALSIFVLAPALVLTLASAPAFAQNPGLGFSSAADLYCGFERDLDLAIPAPGTLVNSSVFVGGTDGYFSLACTFCVSDKNAIDVGSMSVIEQMPPSWTISSLENSEDNDSLPVAASIQSQFPNYVCWRLSGADFTFASPFFAPDEMFTLSITANADFQFVLDAQNSGWFKTDLSSGDFDVCDSLHTVGSSPFVGVSGPAIAVEQETSWSGVKKLFR